MLHYELKKLFSRKIVWAGFAALLLLQAVFSFHWGYSYHSYEDANGNLQKGAAAISFHKQVAEKYAGAFTDETVQAVLRDHPPKRYPGALNYDAFSGTESSTELIVKRLFMDIQTGEPLPVNDVIPSSAGELRYGYTDGWTSFLYIMQNMGMFLSIFLILALSPLFSEEYSRKTDALLFSSKHGKSRLIFAKLGAGVLFTTVTFAGLTLLNIGVFASIFGFSGWDASLQLDSMGIFSFSPVSINFLEATGLILLLSYLGQLAATLLTCAVSAVTTTPFITLILTAVFYGVPRGLVMIRNETIVKWAQLAPVNSISAQNSIAALTERYCGIPYTAAIGLVLLLTVCFSLLVCFQTARRHAVK